jgi:hypothetical protein
VPVGEDHTGVAEAIRSVDVLIGRLLPVCTRRYPPAAVLHHGRVVHADVAGDPAGLEIGGRLGADRATEHDESGQQGKRRSSASRPEAILRNWCQSMFSDVLQGLRLDSPESPVSLARTNARTACGSVFAYSRRAQPIALRMKKSRCPA